MNQSSGEMAIMLSCLWVHSWTSPCDSTSHTLMVPSRLLLVILVPSWVTARLHTSQPCSIEVPSCFLFSKFQTFTVPSSEPVTTCHPSGRYASAQISSSCTEITRCDCGPLSSDCCGMTLDMILPQLVDCVEVDTVFRPRSHLSNTAVLLSCPFWAPLFWHPAHPHSARSPTGSGSSFELGKLIAFLPNLNSLFFL